MFSPKNNGELIIIHYNSKMLHCGCENFHPYDKERWNKTFHHNIVICTLIDHGEPLGLVRPVRVEIQDNKVGADVNNFPRWVSPIEPRHHLIGVTVQQLNHICLVHDVEESEVKEDD